MKYERTQTGWAVKADYPFRIVHDCGVISGTAGDWLGMTDDGTLIKVPESSIPGDVAAQIEDERILYRLRTAIKEGSW